MRITLEDRAQSPAHCQVAVFVDGANAGTLTLRQEERAGFQHVLERGQEALELLQQLRNARGIVIHGEHWLERIEEVLEGTP